MKGSRAREFGVRHKKREIPAVLWMLALASLINVGGLSLLWPVNSIYIHVRLLQSMSTVGWVLMVYSGSGFVGSLIGGWLYDRVGPTWTLAGSSVLAAAVIVIPALDTSFVVYIGVMATFGLFCAIPFPVLNAIASHAWPEGGRRAFNFLYVSNNIGVAIGTAIGGLVAAASFQAVFFGICIGYLVFVGLTLTLFRRPFLQAYRAGRQQRSATTDSVLHIGDDGDVQNELHAPIPWGAVLLVLMGFLCAWSVYVQWQSTLSVDMQALRYPLAAYSILWTMNGALIFLGQPIITWVVRRLPVLTLHMLVGVCLYVFAFGLLLVSHAYIAFVAAMILTTFGEMFAWPSVPAAVSNLAPPSKAGLLQGLVGGAATLGRMIGPLYGGYLYDAGGIHSVLLFACSFLSMPLLLFIVFHFLTKRIVVVV
ncbi:MFS transporter [Alicyclobacillus sp. SP_1]|uniref:MFS transporter n=1 Tax=Alicyclobacillus sp. SP_1 TaxID=2942475 RepID=UPI0021589EF8|nr:MFS transporter [Alicyclobacillus sp. SP_1]